MTYTVSFETREEGTAAKIFQDSFAGGNTVCLRADRTKGSRQLKRDEVS